jgi:hypothetical protein
VSTAGKGQEGQYSQGTRLQAHGRTRFGPHLAVCIQSNSARLVTLRPVKIMGSGEPLSACQLGISGARFSLGDMLYANRASVN